MTVILNEAAIVAFMETNPGVVRFVERTAFDFTEDVQERVADYFHTAPTLTVDQDVDLEMRGSTARIGIRDNEPQLDESKGRRLVRTGLLQKWMAATLEEHRI